MVFSLELLYAAFVFLREQSRALVDHLTVTTDTPADTPAPAELHKAALKSDPMAASSFLEGIVPSASQFSPIGSSALVQCIHEHFSTFIVSPIEHLLTRFSTPCTCSHQPMQFSPELRHQLITVIMLTLGLAYALLGFRAYQIRRNRSPRHSSTASSSSSSSSSSARVIPPCQEHPLALMIMTVLLVVSVHAVRTYMNGWRDQQSSPLPFPVVPECPVNEHFRWVGLGLLAAGVLVLWHGMHALGEHWTPYVAHRESSTTGDEDPDHSTAIVRTGPFRWVRHPMYSGLLLMFVGVSVCTWDLHVFLTWGLLVGFFLFRYPREEKTMVRAFGSAYERYRQEVPYALIPFVL